ncbi:MAG: (2Fe-2S) ferredoxin domain-containing protein [Pseudomonadota bacterium]
MTKKLIVCVNYRHDKTQPSCASRGSLQIAEALRQGIEERDLDVDLETFCCLGRCDKGPNLRIAPGGEFRHGVKLEDVPEILDALTSNADA